MLRGVRLTSSLRFAPLALFALGCASASPAPRSSPRPRRPLPRSAPVAAALSDPAPGLRLPADVHPRAESLELALDPALAPFSGTVTIDVTR